MTQEQVQQEINLLEVEIDALQKQIDEKVNKISSLKDWQLNNADGFTAKLEVWLSRNDKETLPWYPFKSEYPALHTLLNGYDLDRYREYELEDYFEDEIELLINNDEEKMKNRWGDYWKTKHKAFKDALEECIEHNIGGFTCDW